MTSKEHLIEQHILEWEARRKHVDELYQRAHQVVQKLDDDDAREVLDIYKRQHDLAHEEAEAIKSMPVDKWREETVRNAGPMAIWDILAQKLEDFVERHEK